MKDYGIMYLKNVHMGSICIKKDDVMVKSVDAYYFDKTVRSVGAFKRLVDNLRCKQQM